MNIEDQILREIDHLTTIIQNEEKQAEQRIQFFLILAVGSISILALFQKWDVLKWNQPFYAMTIVLSVLFLYGLHTLNRMNWRMIYIKSSHIRIRAAFNELAGYNDYFWNSVHGIDKIDDRNKEMSWIMRNVRGSPAEFMYITNALILTGVVFSFQARCFISPYAIFLWSIFTFSATVIVLYLIFSAARNKIFRDAKEVESNDPAAPDTQNNHAGI